MANSRRRGGRVSSLINSWEERGRQQSPGKPGGISQPPTPAPGQEQTEAPATPSPPEQDDNESSIQGLTPGQIQVLAIKVYDLLLDEIRLEAERTGRRNIR